MYRIDAHYFNDSPNCSWCFDEAEALRSAFDEHDATGAEVCVYCDDTLILYLHAQCRSVPAAVR